LVLITGGSSGIGAATALLLSKLGCSVACGGRSGEKLAKVTQECQQQGKGSEVLAVEGDLSHEKDVKDLLEKTLEKFGKLDILVNCAGILPTGTIENTSLQTFDEVMNVNVRAVFYLTSLAVPHLIKTEGCIVNVSSVNGLRSFPGVLGYNMSKAALDQFTRCVALELAPKKVRCNSVNPGVIVTGLQRRGGLDEEAYQKFLEHSKTTHALGRPGEAEEVARAIAFLASAETAGFITGATLPVDGGRHAMCPR
ncbi:predicted protein, partial [Nematostella vectensis]